MLRGKRIKKSSKRAIRFISSIQFDAPIARYVVKITMAHMLSLMRSGEVQATIGAGCLKFLTQLPQELELDRDKEDVHHMIEQEAIKKIGINTAGYLNLGKSRNDQVATALRMAVRNNIILTCGLLVSLQEAIVKTSRMQGATSFPGYTHLQRAQPVTLAHHFQSYFDAFQRDIERLVQAYARANLSPMGSAALAGTSVATDRRYVASLLGFDGLIQNSIDGVSSRDFAVEVLASLEMVMIDLSRLAEELILWSSTEFGLAELADEYTATSSIMPQKKNPVVAETVRAKCGSVLGDLAATCSILKALPYSYNLDLQEVTPHLWSALSDTRESIALSTEMLLTTRFNNKRIQNSLSEDMSTATELANFLVRRFKIPFREAHAIVAVLARISSDGGTSLLEAATNHLSRVSSKVAGKKISLDESTLRKVLNPLSALALIQSEGGANPRFLRSILAGDFATLRRNKAWIREREAKLANAERLLNREVKSAVEARA